MRTVVSGVANGSASERLEASTEWETLDAPGFSRDALLARLAEVQAQVAATGRNRMPSHVENSLIRQVVEAHPEYGARSIYPIALANALVIFSQIPHDARRDLDVDVIVAAVHHERGAHAVLFGRGPGELFTVRVRHDDRDHLLPATDSMVSALASPDVRFVHDVELREVNGGLIGTGSVIAYRSRPEAWLRAVLTPIPRTLLLVGLVLTLADVGFFVLSHGRHDAWAWLDGFAGRLATAAFGAALISAAGRAGKLRQLLPPAGRAKRGDRMAAYVDWR